MCSRGFVLSRLLPVPSLGNSVRGELSHLTALQVVLTCRSAKLTDSKDLTPTEAGLSLSSCLYITGCPQLSVLGPEPAQRRMGWPVTTTPDVNEQTQFYL